MKEAEKFVDGRSFICVGKFESRWRLLYNGDMNFVRSYLNSESLDLRYDFSRKTITFVNDKISKLMNGISAQSINGYTENNEKNT